MTIVIFLYKDGLSCYNGRIYGHQTTGKEYLMAKTADTIAIYSRKSRYTGKGESIGNQIDLCREYIRTHYGDAAAQQAVVFEDEGFSGGNLNRPDFKKMMTAAKERKIRAIVVYRLDRISRNISDFSSLIEELSHLDIAFISMKEQFDTSTPMGRAMMYIASVFSQLERETIAERIRDNMHELAKTGRWLGGITPTGYASEAVKNVSIDGKTRKSCRLKLIPEEAAVVRRVFSEYLQGKGTLQIANLLQREGIPRRFGGQWCASSVREMLINEKYTGDALLQKTYSENHLTKKKIRNHGELTQYYAENTHPAIIDHETFERVQLERAARWASENVQNPTYARYLFSGRVVCGNCGAHYNRRTQTNGRGTPRRITWQCVTYSTKGKRACPAKQIPERTLMELTCEVLETGELTEETMNRLSEIRITGPNQVRFLFLDGRMVEKVWQDRSRAESWTDEMKQRASEQMKRRHRHE